MHYYVVPGDKYHRQLCLWKQICTVLLSYTTDSLLYDARIVVFWRRHSSTTSWNNYAMYTLFNKDQAAWYFIHPAHAVT
jgi:hypothetical protein